MRQPEDIQRRERKRHMRGKGARFLAGILAAVLVISSGSSTAYAGNFQVRTADTKAVTAAPQNEDTEGEIRVPGEGDTQTSQDSQGTGNTGGSQDSQGTGNTDGSQDSQGTGNTDGSQDSQETGGTDGSQGSQGTENTDGNQSGQGTSGNKTTATDSEIPENGGQPQEPVQKKESVQGSVEVRLLSGIEVKKEQNFRVVLEGSDGSREASLKLTARSGNAAPEDSIIFEGLNGKSYTLKISGDRYVTYTQTIDVENTGCRVQVNTGRTPAGGGSAKPGLICYGDVTGDGVVDDQDENLVVSAVDEKKRGGVCDLNGDGVVDLLDLNYVTAMKETVSQTSAVEKLIPNTAVEPVAVGGTDAQGSLKDLLTGENGGAKLSPSGGQIVSTEHPVEVGFDFTGSEGVMLDGIVVNSPRGSQDVAEVGQAWILYEDKNGQERFEYVDFSTSASLRLMSAPTQTNSAFKADWDKNGALCIDLGGKIAIKHVTLRITKTANSGKLVDISRVEFLNDMDTRIPEPAADIPTNLQAEGKNKSFVLEWNPAQNVTGYEVYITGDGKTDSRKTTSTSLTISQIAGDKLKNGTEYKVSVRSTNGEWKSAYCKEVSVTPKATSKPPAPDNVSVTGSYRSIEVRWKKTEDADSYNVYWKEDGASQFQKIAEIEGLYSRIDGLKDNTKYIVYVTATNELGEGPKSLDAAGKTLSGLIDAKLPAYKLINTSNGKGVLSSHIKAASIKGAYMVDSALDTEEGSALGLFDNRYESYVQRDDWDYGGAYPADSKSMVMELDDVYDLGMIAFAEPMDIGNYTFASVYYWDESGTRHGVQDFTLVRRTSGSRKYYLLKFKEPVHTSKIQMGIGRDNGRLGKVTVSEIRLYEYDSLEQDIWGLYSDDLHIFLRPEVNADTIQALQDRLDTADPVSGEYHPEKTALQKELDNAKELLETGGLGGVLQVNTEITAAKDNGISVGGLNAWQPLGVSAAAGEELVVYVGNPAKSEGSVSELQLIYTQQHGEAARFFTSSQRLKIGRNEITVPDIASTDKERGGALYIQYNGSNSKEQYAVRVSGGTVYPVLRLYGVTGQERTQRIEKYVEELSAYVPELAAMHEEAHKGSGNENVAYDYNAQECIANFTDIQMDQMMLSIPASQVLDGLGNSGREERLSGTVEAMENMMLLFYQHKGLTNSFAEGTDASIVSKNHLPYRYLNIRYMKMFAGAFMYAAGNHIGIEWPETKGLMGGVPVVADAKGKYQSGQYYGWGIAHEIGHEINQGAYAYAEVTNNFFSILAQAKDTNDSVRFKYPEVFKKVTSGAEGHAENVFTQLGMYWQLHLAYDRDYNYKTYDTYQEIFDNLFFARVDSYVRDTGRAPAPGGVKLTLAGNADQNLMRLASAAAEKDLSEFFIRWGMTPDAGTAAYMKQFEPEKRAIYYVDDAARVYEMEHGYGAGFTGKDAVTASVSVNESQVTLTITPTAGRDILQGYEIVRVFTEEGQERRETAGFTQENTFTDNVAFAANHVIRYEVTAIDKYMNRSNVCQAGQVKIKGDGLKDNSNWTASTNMTSPEDMKVDSTEDKPCGIAKVSAVSRVMDNDKSTTFTGTASGEDPVIVLELNQLTGVTALNYTLSGGGKAITDYKIEVSSDGKVYREVSAGKFALKDGSQMVYFTNGTDKWVCTFDAAYVRLTAVGQAGKEISVSELSLYGPSGDNVEFLSGENAIGTLSGDYQYGKTASEKIPKGSIVFTGSYKGNPAYNVVVLYDENGRIVGGQNAQGDLIAHQIILADDPGDAMLGETSDGTWIYWIEPSAGVTEASLPGKVRAELYRVDNAMTNEGQRMVSDTKFVSVPKDLPSITIKK